MSFLGVFQNHSMWIATKSALRQGLVRAFLWSNRFRYPSNDEAGASFARAGFIVCVHYTLLSLQRIAYLT